jgi:hypothetical protein
MLCAQQLTDSVLGQKHKELKYSSSEGQQKSNTKTDFKKLYRFYRILWFPLPLGAGVTVEGQLYFFFLLLISKIQNEKQTAFFNLHVP